MALPESSWGSGGNHFTWLNQETEWMWPIIHGAERRMESLVALPSRRRPASAPSSSTRLPASSCSLQSSDWPFLVTTGQAKEYASQRFTEHVDRFEALADIAERGDEITTEEADMLVALADRDNPFPTIDYRSFRERQGHAELNPAG